GDSVNASADFLHALRLQTGCDHHKLVPAHARNIVIFTASQFELVRECLQHLVPGQVTELIINLLEPVEITDDDRQTSPLPFTSGDLGVEMKEQGACVWQPGEIVGGGRIGCCLILDGV